MSEETTEEQALFVAAIGLKSPAFEPAGVSGTHPFTDRAGTVIGPYKLLELIGVGGAMDINDKAVFIGASSEGGPGGWNGLIDDVRIYNCGLSESQIKALYAGKGTGTTERGK